MIILYQYHTVESLLFLWNSHHRRRRNQNTNDDDDVAALYVDSYLAAVAWTRMNMSMTWTVNWINSIQNIDPIHSMW